MPDLNSKLVAVLLAMWNTWAPGAGRLPSALPIARAIAQVSAHGRPASCTVGANADGVVVEFDSPQRPVAPGQTVALYDVVDPDAVVGAGIAA